MEVILLQDIDNLGYKNDIIDVRPGYANNYLIPRGLVRVATPSARKMLAENIKQQAHKEQRVIDLAEAAVAKIAETPLKIVVKAEDGRIFGSITPANLSDALKEKDIEVDRKEITVDSNSIKTVGEYEATARIYKEIIATISFEVVAEE